MSERLDKAIAEFQTLAADDPQELEKINKLLIYYFNDKQQEDRINQNDNHAALRDRYKRALAGSPMLDFIVTIADLNAQRYDLEIFPSYEQRKNYSGQKRLQEYQNTFNGTLIGRIDQVVDLAILQNERDGETDPKKPFYPTDPGHKDVLAEDTTLTRFIKNAYSWYINDFQERMSDLVTTGEDVGNDPDVPAVYNPLNGEFKRHYALEAVKRPSHREPQ